MENIFCSNAEYNAKKICMSLDTLVVAIPQCCTIIIFNRLHAHGIRTWVSFYWSTVVI